MLKKLTLLSMTVAACLSYALLPAAVVDQKMLNLSHMIGAETLIDLSVTDPNIVVGASPSGTTDTTVGDLGGHNNVPGINWFLTYESTNGLAAGGSQAPMVLKQNTGDADGITYALVYGGNVYNSSMDTLFTASGAGLVAPQSLVVRTMPYDSNLLTTGTYTDMVTLKLQVQ